MLGALVVLKHRQWRGARVEAEGALRVLFREEMMWEKLKQMGKNETRF